jgi:hypothetical protein
MVKITKTTWTRLHASFTKELAVRAKAEAVVDRITTGIAWWAAAVFTVAIKAGTAAVRPITTMTKKPRTCGVDDDGNFTVPMKNLFPGLGGSVNDYNVGGLFAVCCLLAGVRDAATAITAEAWQRIGARFHLLTHNDLHAASDAMRRWYVGPKEDHNVGGLKATIADALGTATAEAEAEAEAVATAKAERATTKAKAAKATAGSRMQALSDGMTRTKAKADALAWLRADPAGFRADAIMRANIITANDKATAKATALLAKAETKAAA